MPADASAAPRVRAVPVRKRRLLSALRCSPANIFSSLFDMRHLLLAYHCRSSVAFEGFSSCNGTASSISDHSSGDVPRHSRGIELPCAQTNTEEWSGEYSPGVLMSVLPWCALHRLAVRQTASLPCW